MSGFLIDRPVPLERVSLTRDFVTQGFFGSFVGRNVLYLRSVCLLGFFSVRIGERNVCVHPQTTVSGGIEHPEIFEDFLEFRQKGPHLPGRPEIWGSDNFEQRDARAVVIDPGVLRRGDVAAGVL